jgi:hypothetical protein
MKTAKHSREHRSVVHRTQCTEEWHKRSFIMRYLAALTGSRPRPPRRRDPPLSRREGGGDLKAGVAGYSRPASGQTSWPLTAAPRSQAQDS